MFLTLLWKNSFEKNFPIKVLNFSLIFIIWQHLTHRSWKNIVTDVHYLLRSYFLMAELKAVMSQSKHCNIPSQVERYTSYQLLITEGSGLIASNVSLPCSSPVIYKYANSPKLSFFVKFNFNRFQLFQQIDRTFSIKLFLFITMVYDGRALDWVLLFNNNANNNLCGGSWWSSG